MEDYTKEELVWDLDLLIQAWTKSGNENTTFLADSLATYVVEKLNVNIVSERNLLIKFLSWYQPELNDIDKSRNAKYVDTYLKFNK